MILLGLAKSEKAIHYLEADNGLVFKVAKLSSKPQIKKEVEELFKVKVRTIKTYYHPDGHKLAVVKLTKDFSADDVSTKLKMIA
jgi:large subunit ribosomal protein L23